jgi:fumarate hydratase, class I
MLNPSDSVVEWVLKTVPTMGAGWCPPGMLGIGIGGTAEKAMLLAKQSLMDPIDIQELIARGPKTTAEKLRVELYDKVNRSASARRASAASPPCSTSRCWTTPPTPPICPSP